MESHRSAKRDCLRYFPDDIKNDLGALDISEDQKNEILTCAYQYTRCVIPHHVNKRRYVAFMRTIIVGTIAEFRGDLVDIVASDVVLGFDIGDILADLFEGSGVQYVRCLGFNGGYC